LGIALITPLMLMVAVFFLFPLANAIYYVFVDFDGLDTTPPFVGFDNFVELWNDPNLWPALKNNMSGSWSAPSHHCSSDSHWRC
jgi:ABC-type sugar transport system permease subunit